MPSTSCTTPRTYAARAANGSISLALHMGSIHVQFHTRKASRVLPSLKSESQLLPPCLLSTPLPQESLVLLGAEIRLAFSWAVVYVYVTVCVCVSVCAGACMRGLRACVCECLCDLCLWLCLSVCLCVLVSPCHDNRYTLTCPSQSSALGSQ